MPESRSSKLLLLIAIISLAAVLRFYRIGSLPPGDSYDPAVYGLDALAILQGERPIYLPTNFGREAMFSYLVAACVLVLGVGPPAVYVASALVGVMTVAVGYLAAEEMFSTETEILRRWGGLLTALAMAVSYWHLSWSRLGVRAILVPLFAALTAYCFWRGQRIGSHWPFIGCGVSLGLSLYTYQAARLLPLVVLLGFACVAWDRRSFTRRDLLHLILVSVVALGVFAPMGYYWLAHPGLSNMRIEQTLVVGSSEGLRSDAASLLEQAVKAVEAFFLYGSTWPKVNPRGRPALNPFLSLTFLLGTAIALFRIKRPRYFFLLVWLGVLALPAVLAHRGPTTKRAIGALPVAMMLVAIGCLVPWDHVLRWTIRRSPSWAKSLSSSLAVLIALGFAYSAVRTYRDYFVIWGRNPELFTHFEAGLSAIGEYVGALPAEERVYLSSVSPAHPSVQFSSEQRATVKGYNGRVCLVLADDATYDTIYVVVPSEDKNGLALLEEHLPQGSIVDEGPLHYQSPYFIAYRVPARSRAHVSPSHVLHANWDNKIQLLGYDLDKSVYKPGETIHVTLYYKGLHRMQKDYTVFTHLLGSTNPESGSPLWAQDDSEPCRRSYPTSTWGVGEIVVDRFAVQVPAGALPGAYRIEMGLYDWHTLERLPVLSTSGQVAGDHVALGQVLVTE